MNNFHHHARIRDGIIEYARMHEGGPNSMEGLLSYLGTSLGKRVNVLDVSRSFYVPGDVSYHIENGYVDALARIAMRDNSAIERLGVMLGTPISEMNTQEMAENVVRMFTMPYDEYARLRQDAGLTPTDEFDQYRVTHRLDGTMLLGVSEKHGIKLGRTNIADRVSCMDFDLGYFEGMFKGTFAENSRNSYFDKTAHELWEEFHAGYDRQRSYSAAHTAFDDELRKQHKIPAPELMPDRAISLVDTIPYAIAFTPDNKLVVLSQNDGPVDEDSVYLRLSVYDPATGRRLSHVKTSLLASFDGTALGADSFQGSLSVGSDGIIYGCGSNRVERFNGNLYPVDENASRYQDAIAFLKEKEILGWKLGVFQIAESDGILYFTLQPNNFPKFYNNVLIAVNGKRMIGRPMGYSPSGDMYDSSFDNTPRIIVDGDGVFIKVNHSVLAIDKSLTDGAYKAAFRMADEKELDSGCVPSNHCVDTNGRLWVATKLPKEPVASIKCYQWGNDRGEIATHFYPENHPGGWPAMRSMGISSDGTLAYTDVPRKRIDFYKLR